MSANTKFAKQSILGKPPSSSRPKPYAVPTLPNSTAFPKVGETNALSNPVTSNSVPSSRRVNGCEKKDLILQESLGSILLKLIGKKNQSANVSKSANQKKHKAQVWNNQRNIGSKKDLLSPMPSNLDLALVEPINKRFPSSTFSMSGCQKWFDTLLIPLLSEYNLEDKEDHGDNECDT
ncbi:hypothetical protein Tco_1474653 [Tanacetum coccineum]